MGESLVLIAAIELAQRRGHTIAGIHAAAPAEAAALRARGLPVWSGDDAAAFIAAHDCDAVISIVNGHILDAATLAMPRLGAINYHNAPLPRYAGMWATATAILNGEATHGITWHRMAAGIDTGPVIAQRIFALAGDETAMSLNARCSAAAIDSFDAVLDALERGDVAGQPQDLSARTYVRRGDTAPNGGVIDWRWTVERIGRLVRACDWGATPSDFGRAQVMTEAGPLPVRGWQAAEGHGPPGRVLAANGASLTVACADGAVRVLVDAAGVAAGSMLPPVTADASPARPVTAAPAPSPRASILPMIAALVAADGGAPAIEDGDRVVTRGELLARAQAVAAALTDAGLRREDGVGILLPTGRDFVAAALGAMLAGGAYVPLNPAAPPARHRVEIEEAGVTHVVTTGTGLALAGTAGVAMDRLAPARFDGAPLASEACAYRIFTSGSTGRPKAVEIGHAALANLVAHYHAALPMGAGDRMTMLAHPGFDASVADIWPVLAAGGALLVPPAQLRLDAAGLIAWLAASRATAAFVPTATAQQMLGLAWPGGMALRTLLTGGDTLHRRPPPGLPFRLVNTYGPTENTVDSLWGVVAPGTGRPTIGRPVTGVTAKVVDAAGAPVPPGKVGELVLGGAQLARGYRGRPELTDAAFGPDRSHYRTGDLVRVDAHGDYEFHGRIDDQVQLQGIRVEPGEIEALLLADDRVADAVCLAVRDGEAVTGLRAHVVPAAAADELAAALRVLLAAQLPPAIVPREIVLHAALPRTAAGKIDRAALLPPADAPATDGGNPLLDLWTRALPGGAGGDDDSFWDLGGDSLAAVELLLAVETRLGVRVPIGQFLADPTHDGLRRAVAAQANPAVVRLSAGTGPPLVLWHGINGGLDNYQQLAALLPGREIVGLRSPVLADPARPDWTIEAAVAAALAALRQFGISQPPALLGYSWGGLCVFEAARQLAVAGTPSPFVGMIGTMAPFRRRTRLRRAADLAQAAAVQAWRIARGQRPPPPSLAALVARYARLFRRDGDLPPPPAWVTDAVQDVHVRMGQGYRPLPGPEIAFNLYRESGERGFVDTLGYVRAAGSDLGWRHWPGARPVVHWLDADHANVMKGEQIARLAALLGDHLDALGDGGPVGPGRAADQRMTG